MFSNCQRSNFLNILIKDTPAGELFLKIFVEQATRNFYAIVYFFTESRPELFSLFFYGELSIETPAVHEE